MSEVRLLLRVYRIIQYFFTGRYRLGIMPPGKKCCIEPFKIEENHGDVVHPCVRYIPEGYEGHCWWLVYTPYYNADASMENPILCYAESNKTVPPTEWKIYCEVKGKPSKGYNSDPVLLYDNGQLYVFWREYGTETVEKLGHKIGTFGRVVRNGKINDEFGPVLWSEDALIDPEVSPAIISKGGRYICMATHLRFHLSWITNLPHILKTIFQTAFLIFDLLGFKGEQKGYGYSIWESKDIKSSFNYKKTIKFKNKNPLYRPWHMDLFEYDKKLYAIIQSNQCNADICLAYSDDYENFTFFKRPLITNETIDKLGIYKPTAGVTENGMFYLYYTAQDKTNRALNKLYLTQKPFGDLKIQIR